jgi:hypothetical protein
MLRIIHIYKTLSIKLFACSLSYSPISKEQLERNEDTDNDINEPCNLDV